jgi:hypothetical protein
MLMTCRSSVGRPDLQPLSLRNGTAALHGYLLSSWSLSQLLVLTLCMFQMIDDHR